MARKIIRVFTGHYAKTTVPWKSRKAGEQQRLATHYKGRPFEGKVNLSGTGHRSRLC